jgi:hypothetical protein
VIDRCLEKDSVARFETTADLVSALETLPRLSDPQIVTPTQALTAEAPSALSPSDSGSALRTPDLAPRTPDPAPRTPDSALRPPDSAPALRTPDPALRTPDPALRTPDSAPALSTPDPALAPRTSHSAPRTPLYWWRFHQFAAALAYWAMVWPAWHVHRSLGRGGLFFFFALLAAVVVAGNLRLHLWFSSRVYPEYLAAQRTDVSRWIRGADIAFAALLIIGGIALPEERAGWAAVLISFGIGSALAFLFIEPATARAAFRGSA